MNQTFRSMLKVAVISALSIGLVFFFATQAHGRQMTKAGYDLDVLLSAAETSASSQDVLVSNEGAVLPPPAEQDQCLHCHTEEWLMFIDPRQRSISPQVNCNGWSARMILPVCTPGMVQP